MDANNIENEQLRTVRRFLFLWYVLRNEGVMTGHRIDDGRRETGSLVRRDVLTPLRQQQLENGVVGQQSPQYLYHRVR